MGPTTVHLGTTGQYTAIAHYSDGTTKDVTQEATWFSSRPAVLGVTARGTVTGHEAGESTVLVREPLLRVEASTEVIVVPEGTFRLAGTVRDAGVPVAATLHVDSPPLGRMEISTADGTYKVFGVAGETRVIASKDGYNELTRTVIVRDHGQLDLDLELTRPRQDLNGTFQLTVTADPSCSSLPADGRERSYEASVEQIGPTVSVTLSGSEFMVDRDRTLNRFTGFVDPNQAVFRIAGPHDLYYYYYYITPDVAEVLSPGRFFSFEGTVTSSFQNAGLRGTLSGWLAVRSNQRNAPVGACRSTNHTFVLAR